MKVYILFYAGLLHCFLLGLGRNLHAQQITFTDVAMFSGIEHHYTGNFLGGGVSFCDFNNDGYTDINLSSGAGELIYVYENQNGVFTNIVGQMGLSDTLQSETILWADYDNDGDKDLLITNYLGSNRLYRQSAPGEFTDVTALAGISTNPYATTAACWADYNNDGYLDLYIATYSDESGVGLTPNLLYENQGDGTFVEVGGSAGVADSIHHPLAAAFLDYNRDGWQDLYIAHDKKEGNVLYRNNGNGTFSDVSSSSGADLHFDCMGIAIGDYDNNGFPDIYVSNTDSGNGLLHNNGDGTFTEIADSLGIAVHRICWGVNFLDFDNDSDLDLYVSTSHGTPDNYNVLFENNGNGTFTRTSGNGLDTDTSHSYGNAIGDFNNDGFCDIAVLNTSPTSLWQNSGNNNHWIKVFLQGTASNRDGVGCLIELFADSLHIFRTMECGISYLSQNSFTVPIGVGERTQIDSIVVHWLSGIRDVIRHIPVDQTITIVEGQVSSLDAAGRAPTGFVLYPNYPNPFNPSTNIGFRIGGLLGGTAGLVELKIYDVFGREVRTLLKNHLIPGTYEVQWDGRDNFGAPVSSGVYFYQLKMNRDVQVRKLLLLR